MKLDRSRRTFVILSQVYVPDPASVGQHMHDVAREMARRGHQVVVYAADAGYDDPTARYPRYQLLDGVQVVRVPLSSFGKASIARRLLAGGLYLLQATIRAMLLPRIDHVLVSTSPPMCSIAGVLLSRLRGSALTFWAMDINPDQIVAVGALSPGSLPVRVLDWMNARVLARARRVVALDRFMAERLLAKRAVGDKLTVLPPWPHIDASAPRLPHSENRFRAAHGLQDRFVVMYSGNLSPVHPVTTVLEAARQLRSDERLLFLFVGGGLGRQEIERFVQAHGLSNVRLLPYQPLSELPHSLAAADLHVVSMGDAMVGVVHPCKVYGAMAVGRPILVVGPRRSHLADIVVDHEIGWQVAHGDVEAAVNILQELSRADPERLAQLGERARQLVGERFSRRALLAAFCDALEDRAGPPVPGRSAETPG